MVLLKMKNVNIETVIAIKFQQQKTELNKELKRKKIENKNLKEKYWKIQVPISIKLYFGGLKPI